MRMAHSRERFQTSFTSGDNEVVTSIPLHVTTQEIRAHFFCQQNYTRSGNKTVNIQHIIYDCFLNYLLYMYLQFFAFLKYNYLYDYSQSSHFK